MFVSRRYPNRPPLVTERRGTHVCVPYGEGGDIPLQVTRGSASIHAPRRELAAGADCRRDNPPVVARCQRSGRFRIGNAPQFTNRGAAPGRGCPCAKTKPPPCLVHRRDISPVGEAPRGASHTYMRPACGIGDDAARTTTGGCPYGTDKPASPRTARHLRKTKSSSVRGRRMDIAPVRAGRIYASPTKPLPGAGVNFHLARGLNFANSFCYNGGHHRF